MNEQSVDKKVKEQEIDKELSNLKVSEFMNNKVFTVYESTKIKVATEIVLNQRLQGICVLDDNQKLIGVISEKELIVLLASGQIDIPLKYSKDPDSLTSDTTFKAALIKMIKNNRKWLPVIDDQKKVIGIVERCNILSVLLNKIKP